MTDIRLNHFGPVFLGLFLLGCAAEGLEAHATRSNMVSPCEPTKREAWVLGAGLTHPTDKEPKRFATQWAFLFLLSSQYSRVYAVDKLPPPKQSAADVFHQFQDEWKANPQLKHDDSDIVVTDMVTSLPLNIDLRYMNTSAQDLPFNGLKNADIFVMGPDPDWLYSDPSKQGQHTLFQDIEQLVGEATTVYIFTEQFDLKLRLQDFPLRDNKFSLESRAITESNLVWLRYGRYYHKAYKLSHPPTGELILFSYHVFPAPGYPVDLFILKKH